MKAGVRSKRGIILSITLLAALIVPGCTQNKTVKVGIDPNDRPFTFVDGGEKKGFEVDLWQALAKKSKLTYELVPIEMGEMSKALKDGNIDVAIAGKTVLNAKSNDLEYSDPYLKTNLVMLAAAENATMKGKEDLAQKIVATENGSTGFYYASAIPGVKIHSFSNITDAYNELVSHTADAVIVDERNAQDYIKNAGQGKVKIVGDPFNKDNLAIVAKKKNKHLGKISEALQSVSKDGTYEELYTKWFGGKPTMMPSKIKKEMEYDQQHEA
ncbi:glutamine ABC transporter substrate-bindnig protein [Paenibacillus sp. Soil766]|uniref:transporter substrate-binding domain-containing protein n=1 Tax=Paenibacillus sp. Soil766 TaxID=1736404 RepID=UPI000709A44C|nr:transporter substrate-binding domain-containing protein [Paenibacillus sp. Soil766]KRF08094.1 glutamine ABC transporter substrate-bindnig protein [Paenibacillus sp. Soil766]